MLYGLHMWGRDEFVPCVWPPSSSAEQWAAAVQHQGVRSRSRLAHSKTSRAGCWIIKSKTTEKQNDTSTDWLLIWRMLFKGNWRETHTDMEGRRKLHTGRPSPPGNFSLRGDHAQWALSSKLLFKPVSKVLQSLRKKKKKIKSKRWTAVFRLYGICV